MEIDLADALRRFPLPEGLEDVVVNRARLAEGLNTSENTVTKWLANGMPCLKDGSNGTPYEFQLSECYAWRMAVLEAEAVADAYAKAQVSQLRMAFLNPGEDDEQAPQLSAKDMRAIAETHYGLIPDNPDLPPLIRSAEPPQTAHLRQVYRAARGAHEYS